jgi:hypothetical protein
MAFHKINITVNGGLEQVVVPSNMTLMRMLRESLSLSVMGQASSPWKALLMTKASIPFRKQ